MAVVPSVPTITGGIYTTSQVSQLVQVESFMLARPITRVRQTVIQSIPSTSYTALTFTTEDIDRNPDNSKNHSTSVNPSRFTAVYPGWYRCSGGYNFVAGAGTVRGSEWHVNGAVVNGGATQVPNTAGFVVAHPARTCLVYLNVGDYLELKVNQDSGGALNTFVTAEYQPTMEVIWESN